MDKSDFTKDTANSLWDLVGGMFKSLLNSACNRLVDRHDRAVQRGTISYPQDTY